MQPGQHLGTHESLDPYALSDPSAAAAAAAAARIVDTSVDETNDRPDGLPEDIWHRFLQRRAERVALEADVVALKSEVRC